MAEDEPSWETPLLVRGRVLVVLLSGDIVLFFDLTVLFGCRSVSLMARTARIVVPGYPHHPGFAKGYAGQV